MYYFSKIYTGLRIYLTISLLSFIVSEHVFSAEKIDWKDEALKTGNRLAVLDFSAKGISDHMRDILTEQFRQNIKKLKIYEVLDASMTNQVEIFYPGEKIYGECKSKGCILELGRLLKVNYVVAGTIIEKDKEYFVNGKMYSIDLEQEVQGFSIENVSEIDSIRLEMKKLSYNVSGLEVPDTMLLKQENKKKCLGFVYQKFQRKLDH